MNKSIVLLITFLTATIAVPTCHADDDHREGLLTRWIRSGSEKKQREHEEKLAKMQLAAQGETVKKQNALLEEQTKNLELERKIKEAQLKQLELQNAQLEGQKK